MDLQGKTASGIAGDLFGAALALVTGGTPVGVAIVAAIGAGLAIAAWSQIDWTG
jgi:hypothetical protein